MESCSYFNGYRPVILVADLELLKQIQIKDFQDFVDRGLLFQAKRPPSPHNKSLLQLTSTRWKEVRTVLTPSFTTSKLKMMSPAIIEAVKKLVCKVGAKAESGEEFEAGEMFAALALDVVCKSAMGIDYNLQDNPRHGFLKDLLQLMIDAKEAPVDVASVTSTQLTAGDDNEQELETGAANGNLKADRPVVKKTVLDDDDITQNAFVVLVGGFETTSNAMALVTHMLTHNLEIQEKVREELLSVLPPDEPITYDTIQKLTYMNCVIQETMRLYPPAFAVVTREAVVDKQYDKIRIPAGTAVMAAVEYIHRDPRHWHRPDVFDPDRFLPQNKSRINPMAMQAFGNGPRNCIGMRFAHMELRYTFAHILRKYRLEKTENSQKMGGDGQSVTAHFLSWQYVPTSWTRKTTRVRMFFGALFQYMTRAAEHYRQKYEIFSEHQIAFKNLRSERFDGAPLMARKANCWKAPVHEE
ncbi:hypothetical protein HPB48_011945 [Haemaphysalis longicornis]|uniref:Cytochrome P450 n=1 Tax=Haemaphysalis longicornis TaxID=44386 RepID=A0A9J6H6D0_HAELO|nr:hypothetical protein HPB48_011945 [Haemaphysalis longicornis]